MSKHIFITGSTDGIGKLTAKRLASEGHTLYLHGRNIEKLESAIAEVKTVSTNKKVFGFIADLSDLHAVKEIANEIKNKTSQLDVLINNAGVFKSGVKISKQHYDLRFAVNYLAPYVLTNELLPIIKKVKTSRIINLSSAAQSKISFDALAGKQDISENQAYAQSKLALTMWSFYLAKKLNDVLVIAVNPGSLLNTKMAREAYGKHWASAEKGADILVDLSLSEAHSKHSGEYFDNDSGSYALAHQDAYNPELLSQLISLTNNLI